MADMIDLDERPDVVVTFTAGGKRFAYTRPTLLQALGLEAAEVKASQASVGKALSWLLKDLEAGKLSDPLEVRKRLGDILSGFDGKVSGNPTRIGSLLAQILKHGAGRPSADLVDAYLKKYPALLQSTVDLDSVMPELRKIFAEQLETFQRDRRRSKRK